VSVLPTPDIEPPEDDMDALAARVLRTFSDYDRLKAELDEEWESHEELPSDPVEVAYFVASVMPIPHAEKQSLLALNSLDTLLERERAILGLRNYQASAVLAARRMLDARVERFGPLPKPFNLN
jgi:Lon protease-like protein